MSQPREKGAVRVTVPSCKYAVANGLTLECRRLRSGDGYLEVFQGDRKLGELWRHIGPVSRWRVYPTELPVRYRCYARTQYDALNALVLAHANSVRWPGD